VLAVAASPKSLQLVKAILPLTKIRNPMPLRIGRTDTAFFSHSLWLYPIIPPYFHALGSKIMANPCFKAAATFVGSFPHRDPDGLLEQIFANFPEMPAWPQLPARDWKESMYVQYSEGLPGAVIDSQSQRIFFRADDAFREELEPFYQAVLEENVERFAVSRDYALGLHRFLEKLRSSPLRPDWLKGQTTGPFSFCMTVTDENKRSLAYDPELFEVAVQGMAMKARWLARQLRGMAPHALVVLDEPYLCSYGSAFVNVERNDVIGAIHSAVQAIHKEDALAGVHCCGNTDWGLVMETGVDVVNFDAYDYFQGLSLYPADLKAFLDRGGSLSWGIVPSGKTEDIGAQELLEKLDSHVEQLVAKGIERRLIFQQSLLTPSCGLGSQTIEKSDRVLDVLAELSALVRKRETL
jgi:hypothetical protein